MITREEAQRRLEQLRKEEVLQRPTSSSAVAAVPINCGHRVKPKPTLDELDKWR